MVEKTDSGEVKVKKFSREYEDITGKWYSDAKPGSHEVQDLHEFKANGITYKVDGHNVVLQYSQHEKEIAELLEKEVGGEIYMLPKVNNPQGVSTPDYLFHGKGYDLKTISEAGKNTIYNRIHRKRKQAESFILDLTENTMSDEEIIRQTESIYRSANTRFVDEIVIVRGGKIWKVFKRITKKS